MHHVQSSLHLHRDHEVKTQTFTECLGFVVIEIDDLKLFVMRGSEDVAIKLGTALLAAGVHLKDSDA